MASAAHASGRPPIICHAEHQETLVGRSRYLTWKEAHPEDTVDAQSKHKRDLLGRAVVAFANSRDRDADGLLLRNSLRALIVIITHVDACSDQDAETVFETMWTQGVSTGRALLYEGWAIICERSKDHTAAEKIFQLGLRRADKACEETFEATLRKGLRDLMQRRRKRGLTDGQVPSEAKKARKRVETKGYKQELLATDDGEEMSFEEWRVRQYSFSQTVGGEPESSPAPEPTRTVDIDKLLPSPVPSPRPAQPATSDFAVFVDEPPRPTQPATSGFSVFVDESACASAETPSAASPSSVNLSAAPVEESPATAHVPEVDGAELCAAQRMPSPDKQSVGDAAAAASPTQIYGAETDTLTARDVFSSLQLPPEALVENLSDILEAIECSDT